MVNVRKFTGWFIAGGLFAGGVGVFYVWLGVSTTLKELCTWSYVESLENFLWQNTEKQEIREVVINLSDKWKLLSESDCAKVAQVVSKSDAIDTGGLHIDPNKGLLDHWGRRIVIAGRLSDAKKPEFVVCSRGRDGVLGTKDDVTPTGSSAIWSELLENAASQNTAGTTRPR